MLQQIDERYGLDLLSEEEIFNQVTEAEIKYRKGKNSNNP